MYYFNEKEIWSKMMGKPDKRTALRVIITGILIIAIILMFNAYTNKNSERISQQNVNYIKNFTVQCVSWIEDLLQNATRSINNMALLYGRTLQGEEINVEDLEDMARNSLFDSVEFINADGIKINGIDMDVSECAYFIKGMQGESGMDRTYTSEITNERLIIFYAPVRYEGEIIGVLIGQYLEAHMKDTLDILLFDEPAPTFLCLNDGTIVSCSGMKVKEDNLIEYVQDRVAPEDKTKIIEALEKDVQYGFSLETDEGRTMAYMASLSGNNWTVMQVFPIHALHRMESQANAAGMVLEMILVLLFTAYMVFLLLQEWYQRKNLLKGKQDAERIITSINRLFSRFITVNLDENTYKYINKRKPNYKNFPESGNYSDFLNFFKDKFIEGYDAKPMSQILTQDNIRQNFTKDVPFERYEYQIEREQEQVWENMAIIVLEWKDDKPHSVLLAVQEITELKKKELQTQNALKEAYHAATAANRAKSEFLSRMSHDIRTPMNAIMGMTAIAALHLDDKTRVEDCLGKISVSSQHLLGLINEVLDMSKIESGKLELINEEFDLSETVNGLLGIFQPQIEAKEQTLSVTISDITHEKVIGDAQRLSQVFVNIMGNAVKFTPKGGSISLHINEIPSRVVGRTCYEFIFTDTGIGMDEEFVANIFEPFSRAGDLQTGKIEGTGLGMSIAKSIVNMMNGDIEIKSKKGEGSQIKVTVFLQYVSDAEEELSMLSGNHVMVVDDEQIACENACNILSSIHMPSVWFTDGDAAIEALIQDKKEENSIVAVILDWKMPKKDGLQVTREIRQKVGEEIPIIILSAYDWSAIEQEALEAGVNEFIAKPLFKSRLIYVMKKVLLKQDEEQLKENTPFLQLEKQFVNKKILLVDDNELNMEIAYELLTMSGFEVDQAVDGKEAVECVMKAAPDTYQAVLMDIQMPVMNGYEATKAIRQSGRQDLETLPIIAMTADAFSDDIKKAAAAGMNGHISKPIDIQKLMDTLKNWIS